MKPNQIIIDGYINHMPLKQIARVMNLSVSRINDCYCQLRKKGIQRNNKISRMRPDKIKRYKVIKEDNERAEGWE